MITRDLNSHYVTFYLISNISPVTLGQYAPSPNRRRVLNQTSPLHFVCDVWETASVIFRAVVHMSICPTFCLAPPTLATPDVGMRSRKFCIRWLGMHPPFISAPQLAFLDNLVLNLIKKSIPGSCYICYLIDSWGEKNCIYAFPKDVSEKVNAAD